MARYIDADLLLKDINESVVFSVRAGYISPELRGAIKILDRIDNAPTADVEEVKHGTWKLFDDGSGRCDQCGKIQRDVWDIENVQNYCCHCGAKMDGGKE